MFILCRLANTGAAAGGIVFLVLYLPYYFVSPRYSSMAWSEKMAACLDLNVAMSFGWIQIAQFEKIGNCV
jgi:ATP-binding cassette subfamily A (ABC1) protein 3